MGQHIGEAPSPLNASRCLGLPVTWDSWQTIRASEPGKRSSTATDSGDH
jgi:hypothetical protein